MHFISLFSFYRFRQIGNASKSIRIGKSLQRDDLLISVELQEIIDMIFGNGDDGANANSDEEDPATTATTTAINDGSGIVANSKFIQLSSIKQDVESTSADCYYPNNGNSVVFRETTV